MHFAIPFSILGVLRYAFAGSQEHVILADCLAVKNAFVRLSHMAYYEKTITSGPNAVAVIPTPRNETAVWIRNGSLSATFPDGVIFTANISAASTQGEFAGTASNGYNPPFNCWKFDKKALYNWYSGVTCDATYDCNHQNGAGDSQSPNTTGTMAIPEPTRESEDSDKSDDIALGVGIGIGIPSLIVALAAVWYASKRYDILPLLHLAGLRGGDDTAVRVQSEDEAIQMYGGNEWTGTGEPRQVNHG